MSFESEESKRKLRNELQQREVKLSKLFEETYQQQKAQHSLDGCFNTLVSAVTVLEKENKKSIENQHIVLENAMQEATKIVKQAKRINEDTIKTINKFQSEEVIKAMKDFEKSIYEKRAVMYSYLGGEVDRIKEANNFLRSNFVMSLGFITFGIGAIGGIIYFFTFCSLVLKSILA
jgi:hypothetical protein